MKFYNNIKNEKIKINYSNSLNSNNEIEINGEIGESWFSDGYTLDKFKSDLSRMTGKIVINIASFGGDLFEALSIYDHIRSLKNKVVTKVVKTSASAATVISLAGDKRYITKNSRYLIHKPLVMMQGNSDDFKKTLEQLQELDKQLINLYVERTNLNEEEILNLMKEEKFISSDEAIKYGFIDDYVQDKQFIDNEDNKEYSNKKNMNKEILNLLQVNNEEEAKAKIITIMNNNSGATHNNNSSEIQATEESASEEEQEQVNNEESESDDVENSEIQATEEGASEEEQEESESDNEDEDNEDDEDVETLKAEIQNLKSQLKKKDDEKIENFINSLIQKNQIKETSKEYFTEIANEKGIEFVNNLLSSVVPVKNKLSSVIKNDEKIDNDKLFKMWKNKEISGDEYLRLIKK